MRNTLPPPLQRDPGNNPINLIAAYRPIYSQQLQSNMKAGESVDHMADSERVHESRPRQTCHNTIPITADNAGSLTH